MTKLLLLLFGGLKFGKILTTGGTMLLSVAAYALIYGWWYAVGFVLLMFVHELGHYLAARQRGLAVGLPAFIPFIGAWTQLKELPHDVETEAWIGIAGPLLGTIGALACYFMARSYDSQLLLAISYSGFFLNLLNLIPIMPLDGGRITAILSPRVWLLGVPILAGVYLWNPSLILILVAIFAIPQVMRAWKFDPEAPENQAYYQVSAAQRLEYGAYYLILVGFLAVITHDVHEMLGPARLGGSIG